MIKKKFIVANYPSHTAAITELWQSDFNMKKLLNERPPLKTIGRWATILLIAAGLQIPLLPPLQAATTGKKITDSAITIAVENEILFDRGVFPNDVDVSTREGIVTLSGSADNLLAKERAVKIAESIRGVRGAIDLITVTPISRPDADIRKDILAALQEDPATESYQVAVSVLEGVATLTGTVGSYAEKQLSARIVMGVMGVKAIRNDVTINYLAKRTDPEIQADILARLRWDIWINAGLISAAVKDGNVTLTGMVGSAIGKSRAYDDAWVNGVVSVNDSGMIIEPWIYVNARKKLEYSIMPDSEIKRAVEAAFRLDPRVSAFSPEVTVQLGEVRLRGIVGNLKAKTSAEQDAKNIVSVWWVDNFLKVRPKERLTDAEMKNQLNAALFWDPLLEGSTIDATVINGVADLSGTVSSNLQKDEAQDVASRTKGVLLVRNYLKVEPETSTTRYFGPYNPSYYWLYFERPAYSASGMLGPRPYLTDEQIKTNIQDRLYWSPFVDLDSIKVTVEDRVATLTGTVGTWIGWEEVDKDAHNGGADVVLNRVKIKKGAWRLK